MEHLSAGMRVPSPAILIDATSTVLVSPGFEAVITEDDNVRPSVCLQPVPGPHLSVLRRLSSNGWAAMLKELTSQPHRRARC